MMAKVRAWENVFGLSAEQSRNLGQLFLRKSLAAGELASAESGFSPLSTLLIRPLKEEPRLPVEFASKSEKYSSSSEFINPFRFLSISFSSSSLTFSIASESASDKSFAA